MEGFIASVGLWSRRVFLRRGSCQALLSISLESLVLPVGLPVSRRSNASRELYRCISCKRVYCSRVTTRLRLRLIITFLYFFPRFYASHCCSRGPIFLRVPRENVLATGSPPGQFPVSQFRYVGAPGFVFPADCFLRDA